VREEADGPGANWDSVEHFKRVQHKWAVWGCVSFLCGVTPVAALIGISFYYPFHVLRHSDAFELATSRLQTSTEAAIRLGTPITIGLPQGAIRAFSGMEEANLHFSVTGPKAKAQAFVRANKIDGPWVLQSLVLRLDGQKDIQLVKRSAAEIDNIARHQAWRVLIDCAEALMANFRSDAEDARNDVRVREHRLWKPASCLPGPLDPRCGASGAGVKLEVHHRFPFAKGGSDDLTNLETLCYACNRGAA
jgi:hypothetical protein